MPAKVKKNTSSNQIPWYIYLVAATLLGGAVYVVLRPPTSSVLPTASPLNQLAPTTFRASSVMGGFTIEIPEGFEVEEKFGTVIIRNQTKQIRISQNSTNFNNLNDYVTSLEELNKINFKEESSIQINNLPIKLGYIENQKTYFILFQYTVYSLSTEDASQYSILDQIAHSFRIQNNK